MLNIKNNLPTMLGHGKDADAAIAHALQKETSLEEALTRLSRYFTIRIQFSQPLCLRQLRGLKTQKTFTFKNLFISERGRFCYGLKRNSRRGRPISLDTATSITLFKDEPSEFKSYEEFKARFDTHFIKEEGIKSLWNSTSGQHGGKYNRTDFRKISKTGLRVMRRFLLNFTNINDEPKQTYPYHQSNLWPERKEPVWVYSEKHRTDHHLGRDITISYQSNAPYIFYSSEYQRCCNGDYGLIVNKNTYLYLEKD